jgi:hypothetical protein
MGIYDRTFRPARDREGPLFTDVQVAPGPSRGPRIGRSPMCGSKGERRRWLLRTSGGAFLYNQPRSRFE